MFKSVFATLALCSLALSLLAEPALSKTPASIDVDAKETATGKDKTPWQTKPAPPDLIMKTTSKNKSVKSAKDKALKQNGSFKAHAQDSVNKDLKDSVKQTSDSDTNNQADTNHSENSRGK